ncbi:MAG: hypothetical protein CL578_05440 [Alteromonadaceae bacterium]|uniref:hypothetical protein n=1 Tax=uncultured Paraglaciecola sp. TaxID=1765024 RepID=UPI000C603C5C|nr:hypothetical protein [Alteromonadaceae bacterium]|tara:strand:- start:3175 stop:4053 length:879 start_codon:yes stop_codon:yes gene_type:complete
MGCNSGSVDDAVKANIEAEKAVKKLQNALEHDKDSLKAKFFAEIDDSFAEANITDGRQIGYSYDIKTEYTSEFSLDKISGVVLSALQAAIAAQDPTAKTPGTSPAALNAYSDVVVAVAEAAKSSSESAASISFSMNRLSPGLYAFLYASSTNIKDEGLFGTEAVTSTAIFYRFMQSIDDIKNEAAFGEALIDASNLIAMKTLQAGLTDRLAKGEITPDDWERLDGQYSGMIDTIRDRLNAAGQPPVLKQKSWSGPSSDEKIVLTAIKKLSSMGDEYIPIIKQSQSRIDSNYF